MIKKMVLAAALAAVVSCGPPATANADALAVKGAATGPVIATNLSRAINALPVEPEVRDGYVRTAFKHWTDEDGNGCNTRAEVIIAEAVKPPVRQAGCTLTGGEWLSLYDNAVITSARELDVDHVVPLAEAWDSGARTWDSKERERYANDLGDPRSLIAVSARSNRSKADKDIAEWRPDAAYTCRYFSDWVAVKTRWRLSVDQVEKDALIGLLASCGDSELVVTQAR